MFSMTCDMFINGVRRSGLGWGCEKTGFSYFVTSVSGNCFRFIGKYKQTKVSVANGLAAPKPPSQVAISCSGRVSISGSI